MPTYEKKLKRSSKDGCVVRYIGKNSKGVSEKFRLGFDLREAERREALKEALFLSISTGHHGPWDESEQLKD